MHCLTEYYRKCFCLKYTIFVNLIESRTESHCKKKKKEIKKIQIVFYGLGVPPVPQLNVHADSSRHMQSHYPQFVHRCKSLLLWFRENLGVCLDFVCKRMFFKLGNHKNCQCQQNLTSKEPEQPSRSQVLS